MLHCRKVHKLCGFRENSSRQNTKGNNYRTIAFHIVNSIPEKATNGVNQVLHAGVCVKELMKAGAHVCVHLLKHTQTKHVTHNTVHGNVY